MIIKAVIFDIGGVLLLGGDEAQIAKWEQRLGLKEGEIIQQLVTSGIIDSANVGAITEEELWRQVGAIYHLNDEQLHEFRDDNWSMQKPNKELIQFLHSLQPRYKTATLSNDWPGARKQQNRLFNLEEMLKVDAMLYSYEEGMQKAHTNFYLLVCERLGVHPEDVIFVDDRQECIDGARHVGMTGILFKETDQTIAEIQACLNT